MRNADNTLKEVWPSDVRLTPKQYAMRFERCHCVYVITELSQEKVVYVGCTANFLARTAEHRRNNYPIHMFNIDALEDELTYSEARYYEFMLIDKLMIQLDNKCR